MHYWERQHLVSKPLKKEIKEQLYWRTLEQCQSAHDLCPTSHCQCAPSEFWKALSVNSVDQNITFSVFFSRIREANTKNRTFRLEQGAKSMMPYVITAYNTLLPIIALQKFRLPWTRERDPLKATLAHNICLQLYCRTLDEKNLQRCLFATNLNQF